MKHLRLKKRNLIVDDRPNRYETLREGSIYFQDREVIPPLFVASQVGVDRYYRAIIKTDAYQRGKKLYLELSHPFYEGTVFRVQDNFSFEFIIKKKIKGGRGTHLYEIMTVNKDYFVHLQLGLLKKNKFVYHVADLKRKCR